MKELPPLATIFDPRLVLSGRIQGISGVATASVSVREGSRNSGRHALGKQQIWFQS
jgi:hypothetical protein